MIKATVPGAGGKPVLVLGLSRANTEMLLAGKPISVELMGLLGREATVLLTAGETDDAVLAELAPITSMPGTRVEKAP